MSFPPGLSVNQLYLGNAPVCNYVSVGRDNLGITIDNTNLPLPLVKINGVIVPGGGGGGGPPASTTHLVYVREGGNDNTGDGSISNPYATIQGAMAAITWASASAFTMIDVGPGTWAESFSWKSWVSIRGSVSRTTQITGQIDINDPSWNSTDDQRAAAQDLIFVATPILDFSIHQCFQGKFYFTNCNFNSSVPMTITSISTINQVIIVGGFWFCGLILNGGEVVMSGVLNEAGDIVLNSTTVALPSGCETIFLAYGGVILNNLIVNYTNEPNVSLVYAGLNGCPVGTSISVNGVGANVNADCGSIPLSTPIVITGGGQFNYSSDLSALGYTESAAIWANPPPATALDAVNRLATQVYTLGGGQLIP